MSQMPLYSSTADMGNRTRKRLPWRCTFGMVARRGSRGGPADAAGASNPAPSEGAIAASNAGDQATARSLAVLFAVRGAQGALLAFPAMLLLVLEPREQTRRRAERPELEHDLAVLLVLRFQ